MYAVVDLETTGGFAQRNRVTEVAIYLFDGEKITDKFHSLVNPEKSIPPHITLLTGITNDMVAGAPTFKVIASSIDAMTAGKILVAHNAGFDYSFLRREFSSLGQNFIRKKLCTVRLSRKIIPQLHSYSLGTLCATLGIDIQHRHRAFGDARATVDLLHYLIKNDQENHLEHALNRFSREGIMPPNLAAEDFDALPEEVGVYYFLNKKGQVIYVGKAKNIRQRVLTHFMQFGRSLRSMEFRHQIANIAFERCGNELIALLLESHEIKKHWPPFNRSQRFTQRCWGIHQYHDQRGYLRLTVARSGTREQPVISFKSFDQAWDYLRRQAEIHGLCKRLCNIQKLPDACLEFHSGTCRGACTAQESPESYNNRVADSLRHFNHLNNSYILLGAGRHQDESSLVWVEHGIYKGFGFTDDNMQHQHLHELTSQVHPYHDNQDIQRIIAAYLRQHPHCKRIKL